MVLTLKTLVIKTLKLYKMKKLVFLMALTLFAVSSCKTKKLLVKEEAVSVVNASPNDISYKYYVIIGSFEALQNARDYSMEIENKGFKDPVILKSETGFYRVSVYSSDFEKDARDNIASVLRIYPEHSDVWLLIKK